MFVATFNYDLFQRADVLCAAESSYALRPALKNSVERGFISTIERTINDKQGEFNQITEDVKTISISLGADVYDKSASRIKDILQEKFPKANVQIQRTENNSAGNTDSAFGFQYEGTKTVQKK